MRVTGPVLSLIAIVASLLLGAATPVLAAGSSSVVISEISMGSSESASDEFVELYNNSNEDINLAGWAIYYKSSTGKTWSKKSSLTSSNIIHAHDYILVASIRPEADAKLTSGMSQTGGVIQVKNNTGTSVDIVGWGTADTSESQVATAAQGGEVIYRSFDDVTQTMQDSDNNFSDFDVSSTETPKLSPAIEIPAPDIATAYPKLSLNELFPNPASPQTDTSDEFIELYNPNNVSVDLSGWILKDAGGTSHIIKNKSIPALGYLTITSAESSLSLNNTGDVILLFSPDNNLVDESADYGDAKEGLTWAVVGYSWSWTVSPTPNAANSAIFVEPDSSKPASVATKATTAKKATSTANRTSAKKTSAAKSKAPADAKKSADSSAPGSSSTSSNSLIWSWLLIALGVGTIGYGIYEYRPEIISAYHRLATKLKSRG